ncbi:Gfo/Idh/MocA family oxidoreductase (plasmid) [Rhizobium acidisoli]|uniref:Gfo/Idh/MocA family oxidoreductase n=1 Tax=Rhizobium acidisoli TaxID=1538158 RepID=A0AAE5WRX1_9HYPH|nr:Gfo/Idh/MocA family oxidoreductase [Rhizobium acidisoli]KPH05564.1 oxidoreductase [Rhizobium acidisoli]QAS81408.1 Gfo/Idh/MocA family oxidoreductase [Rhizobium acidisoli]
MAQTNHMKLRIGVVGCGSISLAYMRNAPLFRGVEITACADINADAAKRRAAAFNLRAADVDALIDDTNIDLILNLTIPAAHFDVSMRALLAGKHVFTEKPLGVTAAEGRLLVNAAAEKSLMLGSAPDTFLGAAGRHARRQMEAGAIGRPVTGTAFMMGRGMEHWHPDPSFYYQAGAGPVMDMGPYYLTMMVNLMGPIRRVQAVATSGEEERLITAEGPKQGTTFKVGTPTSVLSLLEFDCGATVTFGTSWDVFRHSNHPIELHGTEGSLRLPDPDNFGGGVALSSRGAPWLETDTSSALFGAVNWPIAAPDRANYRMLGLADLARAIIEARTPRASGDLALHVLDVMEAILRAGETGVAQTIPSTVAQPAELREDEARSLLA